jgi:multimeric flavodoxin WrbA
MAKPKLLGIAASLRNARWGAGNRGLVEALKQCADKEALHAYLAKESELHLENFLQAGRREGKEFLEIHRNLHKLKGDAGLSNTEVALAAALWGAMRKGADVERLSLAEHFTINGELRRGDELRRALLAADGLLISGPVYFGDRGSLAESLIDFISRDKELRSAMAGRLYGGVSVGAKRNGGQETTLIYQMMDMMGLGMLAVGNDSDTTAQYGGTGHAGDVGTMHKDKYGLDTSVSLGQRMGHVLTALQAGEGLADRPSVLFLVLQDADGVAAREVERLMAHAGERINATVIDVANKKIKRCIACDICPTHIDLDEVYRCIIKADSDDMGALHEQLLHHDMLVPVTASSRDRSRVNSNYQSFIERTRYIRRGDYVWSDLLVAPLAYSEPGSFDSYAIRTMTSFLRHHTVMSRPLVGVVEDGVVVNTTEVADGLMAAVGHAERLAAGNLATIDEPSSQYRPVGYVLSANKDAEDEKMERRVAMVKDRTEGMKRQAALRLKRRAVHSS